MNTVLLSGIVGSTAYGLARPDSDVDRLGVFAAPTTAVLGLDPVKESVVTTRPDSTMHEAGHYAGLLLGGNPSLTELLWLPEDLYETVTPLGEELIGVRGAFLCRRRVRDSYLGFARQQLGRINKALKNPAKLGNPAGAVAKSARHMARLLHQGRELYTTGQLTVRLDADTATGIHEFGRGVAAGDTERAAALLAEIDRAMPMGGGVLPTTPDKSRVQDWILRVREAHWTPQEISA
ncbi:nucleotidyltransferase domain-containing protein [Nocardiopsis sp. CT-R113]|uniref:Nucleotidyltransferase domain-containing protein n=1 Tax=Nocardiopsis codii TaxID=3065942 RepID=A0ABU7KD29_9ACTN|nr:nucleotidyltransferase domain-containing protein [Nocardiopsis sp. CT-R113]MEE2040134.1 nucleotidyltransferase domain-containing protein [Nocardiopsis sp. CT-R113]